MTRPAIRRQTMAAACAALLVAIGAQRGSTQSAPTASSLSANVAVITLSGEAVPGSDNPGATSSTAAFGINERGDAVGTLGLGSKPVWWPGAAHAAGSAGHVPLPYPPSGLLDGEPGGGAAMAINESRMIVGYYRPPKASADHAVVWKPGDNGFTAIDIGTLGGKHSQAFGVNDEGVVVGAAEDKDGILRPFRWTEATGMAVVTSLAYGTSGSGGCAARAISNQGLIAISCGAGDFEFGYVVRPDGVINASGGSVRAVSDSSVSLHGWAAGSSDGFPALLDSVLEQLGPFNGVALGMNRIRQVVGLFGAPVANGFGNTQAFAYNGGVWNDLNTLGIAGWKFQSAEGISEQGVIVGWGVNGAQAYCVPRGAKACTTPTHGFIMRPVTPWCRYELSAVNLPAEGLAGLGLRPEGGTYRIPVATAGGTGACAWAASTRRAYGAGFIEQPWMAVVNPGQRTGTGSVEIAFEPNDSGAWQYAEITVAGTLIHVSQWAAALTVADAAGTEGSNAVFRVQLSKPLKELVAFAYEVRPITATVNDFGATKGSGSIPPGQTFADVSVPLARDGLVDGGETFQLVLTSFAGSGNAALVTDRIIATGTIADPKPSLLTVSKSGSGTGGVASSPAGIFCGNDCSESFPDTTEVTLTTLTGIGSVFAGWSGACSGRGSCSVTMDGAKDVTARFEKLAEPGALRFTAKSAGAAFAVQSAAQTVRFNLADTGLTGWAAAANVPWLTLSATSGTGTTALSVGVRHADGLPSSGSTQGAVTVTFSGGATASTSIPVTLTISAATTAPVGQVDTPAQESTGLTGAIGVTGWALDDVGVASVKIYRNCLPIDAPANCQDISGHRVIFIGDAAFLSGARPDVEKAFPSHPLAYRAGWGYLMMTSMLPHVTAGQAYGGQGPLTLYVFATDVEGNVTLLGRSQADYTPTSITLANDTIAKPFGAIDTPGQGETVSGIVNNFGWALTPDSNTSADGSDILIPTNGSTMFVFIDGAPVSTVTYNQCRGNVGNPVPSGNYCNDDVANIFGNPSPQPVFTTRTLNATRHRNLDAGRAAIGSFQIDTRTLTNGLHTIAWSVTDTANRTEGIGSRFFNVLNGSARPGSAHRAVADARSLPSELAPGRVDGRSGFDLTAPWQDIAADANGARTVRIPELGRLELRLPAEITGGYLRIADDLRVLPAGSRLMAGTFTWAPPAGYLGRYDLVFVGASGPLPIVVTVAQGTGASEGTIAAAIDLPSSSVSGPFTVAGWALDRGALSGAGIGAVHVWAFRKGAEPVFVGAAAVGGERPDIAAEYGAQFARSGWSLTAPALTDGEYQLVAYFWSARTGRFEDARSSGVAVR